MPYGTVNADTLVTSTPQGVLGAGNASIMKNRIINGAMVIDQRNVGAGVTPIDGQYTLDRFFGGLTQASKFSVQQNAGSVTPPVGFNNYLGVTSLSNYAVLAGDTFFISQNIEGFNTADLSWGTVDAKTVTLSFWVRSSLTGTFGGTLKNSAANRSYPFTYTINSANTWELETITIAGDTSGTWVGATNGIGIRVIFGLGAGATFSGTAGAWAAGNLSNATGATSVVGTNGATFYITGCQLEVGSSATGFEYVNYQTSLANCQRYFQKVNCTVGQTLSSSLSAGNVVNLKQTMRTQPTIDASATFTANAGSAGSVTLYTGTGSGTDGNTMYIFNSSANWTVGTAVSLNAGFSAEL
jgi:hypothetical protein